LDVSSANGIRKGVTMSKRSVLIGVLAAATLASAAPAQLLGGGSGGLIGPVLGPIGQITNPVTQTLGLPATSSNRELARRLTPPSLDQVQSLGDVVATAVQLDELRKARLTALIRDNRAILDRDEQGQPVRKGELIAADPDPISLALAQRAGFRITNDETTGDLGLRIVTLAVPKGLNIRASLKAVRKAAPALQVDYNHIYEPAGGALLPAFAAVLAVSASAQHGTPIVMIDGGVAAHPSLSQASIEQRGFAGAAQPTGHGTAVGSLLVGDQGQFHGAARGAQLLVGDVYGGSPAAGSATTIVRALAWAASKHPSVINISLVGPDNRALARAIAALHARGIPLVAAVGNDGPAAPPQFPASYNGVVAVTGVDSADRALIEAGRATHLDFAAPGADLVAALPGKGYTPVRGTSFAAPFVAARLAATGSAARLAVEAVPGKGKVGRGIVCKSCRILPKTVGLK
jgi:hypothetical protein